MDTTERAKTAAGEILSHSQRLGAPPLSTTTTRIIKTAIDAAVAEKDVETERLQKTLNACHEAIRAFLVWENHPNQEDLLTLDGIEKMLEQTERLAAMLPESQYEAVKDGE